MNNTKRDRILMVDLSSRRVEREPVPDRWLEQFLGGKGLGARYLYERVGSETDPLDAENLLAFMIGPLSGYFPGETRYAVVTKSPLTGGFLDSYSGGDFAARFAGSLENCLGVLVTGRADEPVRLEIEDGTCRIEPADEWGSDTVETARAYPDAGVACIGPGGENGVTYATIAADAGEHHAGRGGAGTVMGNKRLKAVVARGDAPEPGSELAVLQEQYEAAYADHETGKWQAAGGTYETVDFANEIGSLATAGWQGGQFDDIEGIGVTAATESASGREAGDVAGDFRFETDDGDVVVRGAAPMSLGAGLGIDDVEDVAKLAETCDRLGIDVIDAGNAVAWAIRAGEKGLVDCPVEFGDVDGINRFIEAIADRDSGVTSSRVTEGDGSTQGSCSPGLIEALSQSVETAGERFGAEDLIPSVKSMTMPAYDPRGSPGMALAYATSDRGACHRRARPIEVETAVGADWTTGDLVRLVVGEQTVRSTLWSLIVDDFVGETMWDDLGSEWLAAIDRPYTSEELTRVGERIWTLVRCFNAREGFDRSADVIPDEILEPVPDGPAAGRTIDPEVFETTLDAYYRARGWGPDGVPTRATVERLDLQDVIDDATPLASDEDW